MCVRGVAHVCILQARWAWQGNDPVAMSSLPEAPRKEPHVTWFALTLHSSKTEPSIYVLPCMCQLAW